PRPVEPELRVEGEGGRGQGVPALVAEEPVAPARGPQEREVHLREQEGDGDRHRGCSTSPRSRHSPCSARPAASVQSEKMASAPLMPFRKSRQPTVASNGIVGPPGSTNPPGPPVRRSTRTATQVGTYCANTAALFRSESRSKSAKIARPTQTKALTAIATEGVPQRGCTRARMPGSSPSSPSAER